MSERWMPVVFVHVSEEDDYPRRFVSRVVGRFSKRVDCQVAERSRDTVGHGPTLWDAYRMGLRRLRNEESRIDELQNERKEKGS